MSLDKSLIAISAVYPSSVSLLSDEDLLRISSGSDKKTARRAKLTTEAQGWKKTLGAPDLEIYTAKASQITKKIIKSSQLGMCI